MTTSDVTPAPVRSTHRVEVVQVILEPHPNADRLAVVNIWGYTCCVDASQWASLPEPRFGAYIPPDSLVPTDHPEFAFLARPGRTHERIRAKRLRGVMSQGLLIPAPDHAVPGDDLAEYYGITHYEPPVSLSMGGDNTPAPKIHAPIYDIESWYRYKHLLHEGEQVYVSEKIHGCNARFVYTTSDDTFHVGSHRNWKANDPKNLWWQAVAQNPWIESWCRANPNVVVYAEVFGQVQDLKYGHSPGKLSIAVFDLLRGNLFLSWGDFEHIMSRDLHAVPLLYVGPYSEAIIRELIDGPSMAPGAGHLREGIVIRPTVERTDPEIGRVILKAVSSIYLERAK